LRREDRRATIARAMDDASKRSAPTLILGSPEGPDDDRPTIRRDTTEAPPPRSARASTPSLPSRGVRRTIRGAAPSSRPPAEKRAPTPSQPPSVVVERTPLAPSAPKTAPFESLASPAYSLPPLPPTRATAHGALPVPLDAPGGRRPSSSGVWIASALGLALVLFTLVVALAFTRRSAPAYVLAPAAATPNVSLLYDGGLRAR
jgi:hypothetical protein